MAIIARISDGLGNQMFQYATARALALQKGTDLFLDTGVYAIDRFRKYELDRLNISGWAWSEKRQKWRAQLQWRRFRPVRWLLQAGGNILLADTIKDRELGFDARLASSKGHVYLHGYWQSERYFQGIRDVLLKEFAFKAEPDEENRDCLARITSQNSVCIHIRRGDYVTTENGQTKHGICSLKYYQDAIELIQSRIPQPTFFIFSDDPEWVKANFPALTGSTMVSHNVGRNDAEDLRLMMHCHHFIIANSSFSWWGAWLGQQPGKIVVAPKRWFAAPDKCDRDLVPESWLRL